MVFWWFHFYCLRICCRSPAFNVEVKADVYWYGIQDTADTCIKAMGEKKACSLKGFYSFVKTRGFLAQRERRKDQFTWVSPLQKVNWEKEKTTCWGSSVFLSLPNACSQQLGKSDQQGLRRFISDKTGMFSWRPIWNSMPSQQIWISNALCKHRFFEEMLPLPHAWLTPPCTSFTSSTGSNN